MFRLLPVAVVAENPDARCGEVLTLTNYCSTHMYTGVLARAFPDRLNANKRENDRPQRQTHRTSTSLVETIENKRACTASRGRKKGTV